MFANSVLDELVTLHREVIFPGVFERIQWSMVASFECEIERTNDKVTLKNTTVWLSPDRNPKSMLRLEFDCQQGLEFGKCISSDKITNATGKAGDMSAILGFSPTRQQADDIVDAYRRENYQIAAMGPQPRNIESTPREDRAADRRRRRLR